MTELEKGLAGDEQGPAEGSAATGSRPSSHEQGGPAAPLASAPPRVSAVRRVVEWLWSGAAMKALDGALPVQAARELDRRARLSLELGRFAIEQTFENGSAEAIACELNRQAAYWALLAFREAAQPTPGGRAGVPLPTFAELWSASDGALLARAAGGETAAEALGGQVREASFARLAELDPESRERLSADVRQLAQKLVAEIDTADREVDRIWLRRATRVGGLLVVGALLAAVPIVGSTWLEQRRDLAIGKPWTTSSKFPGVGCESPLQVCPETAGYFFHTLEEENPWVQIDLQVPKTVSGVRVVNRADCCNDRAVPLVVETSLDKKTWQKVARRTDEFTSWKATFPATSARYVRLTVPRKTLLHFQTVRVLP